MMSNKSRRCFERKVNAQMQFMTLENIDELEIEDEVNIQPLDGEE